MGQGPLPAVCGYTVNLDDLVISDTPGSVSEPLVVSPNTLSQGAIEPGLVITADQPIFGDPDQFLTLGAGVVLSNVVVMDPFTVTATADVSSRALLDGHAVILETPTIKRMGAYQVQGAGDPVSNFPTSLVMSLPPVIVAGEPFAVEFTFDDADGDFVEVFAGIKDLTTHEITVRGHRQVYDTGVSDPMPEVLVIDMPALAAGPYALIGIVDDGIGETFEQKLSFFVVEDVPSVSSWGLLLIASGLLTFGAVAGSRRGAGRS